MKIFKSGDLVRLVDSDQEMLIICYEEQSATSDAVNFVCRCGWEQEGVIATVELYERSLVLIRSECRRIPQLDWKFPSSGGVQDAD